MNGEKSQHSQMKRIREGNEDDEVEIFVLTCDWKLMDIIIIVVIIIMEWHCESTGHWAHTKATTVSMIEYNNNFRFAHFQYFV